MSSLDRWQVKIGLVIFWCITVLTPLVISPAILSYQSGQEWEMEPMYFFLFGAYNPPGGAEPSGWFIGPLYVIYIFMFLFFFIVYALLVTNYCMKPNSQRGPIVSGILSLAITTFLFGMSIPWDARLSGIYAGPLPFQFIAGLIMMKIVKAGIEVPKDELLEEKPSWWEENKDDSLANEQ